MTHGALRISAIALGAAVFVSLSPLPEASAATVVHHPAHAVHVRVAHANAYGRVAHAHAYGRVAHARGRHYVWRNGHRYAYGYGYNPGAAVAAGVVGDVLAGYPYDCGGYSYGLYDGSCDDYGYGSGYPYNGYGYGGYGGGFYGGYG